MLIPNFILPTVIIWLSRFGVQFIKLATIIKQVADVMESSYPSAQRGGRKAAEDPEGYRTMSPEQLMKTAAKLEKKMLKAARDLEFEEAAKLRDEIARVRELAMGLSDRLAG